MQNLDKYNFLVVPGYGGSEEEHWQTLWEKSYKNFARVEQEDWNKPDLSSWLINLEEAVKTSCKPVVLIAHSLGCSLVAHFAKVNKKNIIGAFLVAPADVDNHEKIPKDLLGFSPIPLKKLPFPSLVITSNNDFYVTSKRAEILANSWGSSFVNVGDLGHINAHSNIGSWLEGKKLFERFVDTLDG